MNNISKGRNYNKKTHNVNRNKNARNNLNYQKDMINKAIEHNKSEIKQYCFLDYRVDDSKNIRTDNNLLKITICLKQNENNINKDQKYINLKIYPLEIKNDYNRNIGSILQCILNNKIFIDYFLNQTKEIKNNKDNGILSYSLFELIESILLNKNIKESLINFKNVIDKMETSLLNQNKDNNSNVLFYYLLINYIKN